jgi:phosphopantetheine adenylyltransferase
VVGFNPNKKYQVTPGQRKDLLEKMLQNTEATNIDVAGKDLFIRFAETQASWVFSLISLVLLDVIF